MKMREHHVRNHNPDVFWPDLPDTKENGNISIWNEHHSLELAPSLVLRVISNVIGHKDVNIERLEVILTDGRIVQEMNQRWKSADYETDVMAFSLGSSTEIDAEVYVNLDFARKYCTQYQATFEEEACRYVVHGLLHIMGYEDDTPESRQIMRKLEDQYLEQFDFTDI